MKVCLVRPPILVPRQNPIVQFTPPLGVAYVAGALRAAGLDVCVVDGLGASLDTRHESEGDCFLYGLRLDDVVAAIPADSDIVGVSAAFSFEWPTCKQLIARIRQRFPDALLVGGGEHVTALPELSLKESELEVITLGEGEEVMTSLGLAFDGTRASIYKLPGIAYKLAGGDVFFNPRHSRIKELDSIAWPAWDLIPIEEYLMRGMGFGVHRGRSMPVLASRGCPYRCTFCSSPQMWGTRWLARDPDKLLDELAHYQQTYDIQNFDFYDLTAIVKKAWIVAFCRKIEERGLKFTWQLPSGTRSEAIDTEVALLLYRSGCRNLSYAPESGSPTVLTRIKKRICLDTMIQSIRGSVSAGINVKCNLMMGFPGETLREVRESIRFIARLALAGSHDLSIWAFSPYPGSELFDQLRADGRLAFDDRYFDDLRSYSDPSMTKSYSEHMSNTRLKQLRWTGTVLFYALSWLRYPWRPFVMTYNVLRGVHESRSELALSTILKRFQMATVRQTS